MKDQLPQPLLSKDEIVAIKRQYDLYCRRHRRRPGLSFDRSIFCLYALEQKLMALWPHRKYVLSVAILKDLEKEKTGFFFNKNWNEYKRQLERFKKNKIVTESGLLYKPAWDSLKLGQRVYDMVKDRGQVSPRTIQQRLRISKRETLDRLPLPGGIVKRKRKPKDFVDPSTCSIEL